MASMYFTEDDSPANVMIPIARTGFITVRIKALQRMWRLRFNKRKKFCIREPSASNWIEPRWFYLPRQMRIAFEWSRLSLRYFTNPPPWQWWYYTVAPPNEPRWVHLPFDVHMAFEWKRFALLYNDMRDKEWLHIPKSVRMAYE